VSTPVQFTRLPITLPCPVPVEAETGRTFDDEGEPLPMEQRAELCAVDACWMIGSQVLCDYHLSDLWARGFFGPGDYESLVRDTYGEYGEEDVHLALERAAVPWADRKRYSQEDARNLSEKVPA
jgi:hypothetical protein